MNRKVGFFGGTFDPIHFGHINLAIELMEAHNLDEVWFCPANVNPNKSHHHAVSADHRLHMTKLALEGCSRFKLLDIELHRKGPSYTLDTLNDLITNENKNQDPAQIYLLLSDETAKDFYTWHQPEEIVKLVHPLVGSRYVNPIYTLKTESKESDSIIYHAMTKGWTKTRILEISSTEIRKRLSQSLYCSHLVPEKVLDYIYRNHLYSYI